MDDPSTSGVTEGFDLMFYNARWYDPSLGRFAQADSIVPAGVQGYDRYAYVNNNPVNLTDPSGHCAVNGDNWCIDKKHLSSNKSGIANGTVTVTPTRTPTTIPTRTTIPTSTAIPTGSPTRTPTSVYTGTPSPTATPTVTSTLTVTGTMTATSTTTPTVVPTTTLLSPTSTIPTLDPILEVPAGEMNPLQIIPRPSEIIPVGWGFDPNDFWDDVLRTLPAFGQPVQKIPELIPVFTQVGSKLGPIFSGSTFIAVPAGVLDDAFNLYNPVSIE
jgi:RHS repeat-associated protein